MRGAALDQSVAVGSATALLVVLVGPVGCAGPVGERGRLPPPPPAASIPVAPAPSSESTLESEQAASLPALPAPLTESTTPAASGPEPSSPENGSPETSPPAASDLVSLVDERPFWPLRAEAAESLAPEHRHSKRHGHSHRPYHPAPGIIVDVVDAQGGASAADLQRAARNVGYWPFRRCYEEGLRRDQRLAGKVQLQLLVDSRGAVERAGATGATLADPTVVTCVAREVLHLSLVARESPTETKMVVTLATGDEPVPAHVPVPSADELQQALRAQWPSVTQCYASELSKHPDAGGRMELRFQVTSSGEIAEVAEGATRFCDVDVTRCVLGVYRTSKLPALRALRDVTFAYAMHFEPRSNVLPVQ